MSYLKGKYYFYMFRVYLSISKLVGKVHSYFHNNHVIFLHKWRDERLP